MGDPSLEIAEVETAPATGHGVAVESERIEKVEQDIQTLRNDLAELKRELQEFKNRFE
jgi:predicted ribosome quality control (RQC) complex YloA/Tae2 family protein